MGIFGRKRTEQKIAYDPQQKAPVIHASICNGEQVGGLKDLQTGQFEEIMFIRGPEDLETFKKMVGCSEIPKEY